MPDLETPPVKISVVIPTYNRRPILEKALAALERQAIPEGSPVEDYEVVVVDDGSTDGTAEWLERQKPFGRVRVVRQERSGAAAARNTGIAAARFGTICFIDSDIVPAPLFLHAHADALSRSSTQDDRCFTSGPVLRATSFEDPAAKPQRWSHHSRAFFATGNGLIARHWIEDAGGFDPAFRQYGWEDLELGVRLKRMGLRMVPAERAVGYHWQPMFSLDQLAALIKKEQERARMAMVFFEKQPTFDVRLMIQLTWPQRLLWEGLTLGGLLDDLFYLPLIRRLLARRQPRAAHLAARVLLNRHYVRELYAARRGGRE